MLYKINKELFNSIALDLLHGLGLGLMKTYLEMIVEKFENSRITPIRREVLFQIIGLGDNSLIDQNFSNECLLRERWLDLVSTHLGSTDTSEAERSTPVVSKLDEDFCVRRRTLGGDPTYIYRPFHNVKSLTGEESKSYALHFFPLHLSSYLEQEDFASTALLHYISVILYSPQGTLKSFGECHVLFLYFMEVCLDRFGTRHFPINFHHAIHWFEIILRNGVPASFWLFGGERAQRMFKMIKTNGHRYEREETLLKKHVSMDVDRALMSFLWDENSDHIPSIQDDRLEDKIPFCTGNCVQIFMDGKFSFGRIQYIRDDEDDENKVCVGCVVFKVEGIDAKSKLLILTRRSSKEVRFFLTKGNSIRKDSYDILKLIHLICHNNSEYVYAVGVELNRFVDILKFLIPDQDRVRLLQSNLSLNHNNDALVTIKSILRDM